MIDIQANGYQLYELLAAAPKIDDNIDGICRRLDFTLKNHKLPTGTLVELFFNGKREFYGTIRRRMIDANGRTSYTAYDPLFLFKNEDDWYFKNQTLTQAYTFFLKKFGIKAGKIANTKVVLPQLWYQGKEAGKTFVDMIARQARLNKKIYIPRFNPVTAAADLVEVGIVPNETWAFQVGVNLTDASYEEDAEQIFTQVKLVDRETGKSVVKVNTTAQTRYGKLQKFGEIDKEEAKNIDALAAAELSAVSKPIVRGDISGVNPGTMPIFYSADIIYVEEKFTDMLGSYHIRSASHSFEDDQLIKASFEIQKSAYIPDIQIKEAINDPNKKTETGSGSKKTVDLSKKLPGVNYQSGWKATAYSLNGKTASGNTLVVGRTIAVDPKVIPLGSVVAITVSGMSKYNGVYLAEDTGGVIKGKLIDMAIQPKTAAIDFGRRNIQVAILEKGKGAADARAKAGDWEGIKKRWQQKLTDNQPDKDAPTAGSTKREKVVAEAQKWIGDLEYIWGGKNIAKAKGGDCSGFTYFVFNKAISMKLGHGTATQITKGEKIGKSQAKAGDLVFFKGTIPSRGKNAVSHVGIVTKPGYCISLASSGCKEHSYETGTWGQHFMQLRRVINDY
ncbi:XkdQ/YqbQ family protein [Metabacillus fastidiosus]|uniref:XkdQ/YqbQ family protein n=1 Tax=Metabacillus fastidiosus TaxID=1458 RepID=UPI003D2CA11A